MGVAAIRSAEKIASHAFDDERMDLALSRRGHSVPCFGAVLVLAQYSQGPFSRRLYHSCFQLTMHACCFPVRYPFPASAKRGTTGLHATRGTAVAGIAFGPLILAAANLGNNVAIHAAERRSASALSHLGRRVRRRRMVCQVNGEKASAGIQ